MADISEYLRRQVAKGPKRKKRDGEARTLWNSPTAAAQDEAAGTPGKSEKDEGKQLSPTDKTSSAKTSNKKTSSEKEPNSKTSTQKTSNKVALDRKAKSSVKALETEDSRAARATVQVAVASIDVLEPIDETLELQIADQDEEPTTLHRDVLASNEVDAPIAEDAFVSGDQRANLEMPSASAPVQRIIGASIADEEHYHDDVHELDETPAPAPEQRIDAGYRVHSITNSPAHVREDHPLGKGGAEFTVPVVETPTRMPRELELPQPVPPPQPVMASSVVRPRSRPITVGKAPALPPAPKLADLTRDERFLAKYWLSPGPGGVPRSQERFFHFYRFLYSEAARTGSARVYCTEEMAIEMLGPKARGTFTNYRKLGQRYGMFTVHIVGNLGRRDDCRPGTYFFLLFPWISQ